MKYEDFQVVILEARRFISKAEVAQADCEDARQRGRSQYFSAAKRASLDLSAALVNFRRPK